MKLRLLTGLVLAGSLVAHVQAENWPQWRGPAASGVSGEERLPERWSDSDNVAWKAKLRGPRHLFADRLGRSRVRHVAGRQRRSAARAAPRSGRRSARGRRTSARMRGRRAARAASRFSSRAFDRATGRRVLGIRAAGGRPAALGSRETQPRVAEPGHRRRTRLRVVRHRPDRGDRYVRQAGVEEDISAPTTAPFEINWGHGSSPVVHNGALILLCYHERGVVSARARRANRRGAWKVDAARGRHLLQHAARRARPAADRE